MHLSRVLRKVDFFAPLKMGQLELVLQYMLMCQVKEGENICKQGDEGDAFFIVRDGKYGVFVKKGFFSFAKKIAVMGEGDFFGEMALVTNEPRSATVTCEEPGRLYVMTTGNFNFVLNKNPAFRAEIKQIVELRKFRSKHED